jgi:hypothetical protein
MNHQTDRGAMGGRSRRGVRQRLVAVAAVAMSLVFVGSACAPPSPPAGGGGIDIAFGPLTIPLPPIEIRPPATTIPLLPGCSINYRTVGVQVYGATVTIPGIRIDPNQPIITVPNVVVKIPNLRVPASTVGVNCLGLAPSVQVDLIIPSTVLVRHATLNLTARTITLGNPSFTLNGAGLGVNAFSVVVPLPPIVSIPLPSSAIKF